MANVFKRSGGQYLESVNTPDYSETDWVINPDLANVAGYPVKYWKCIDEEVFLMSEEEREVVDSGEPLNRDSASQVSVVATKNINLSFISDGFSDLFFGRRLVDIELQASGLAVIVFYVGAAFSVAETKRLTNLVKLSTGKTANAWSNNPLFETKDTVGMHDFSKTSEWTSSTDSSWIVDPTAVGSYHYGKKLIVTAMQMDLAEDFTIHEGGNIIVDLYSNMIPVPLVTVDYKDLKDIVSRATSKVHIPCKGGVGPAMQYSYVFTMPPTLWPTVGLDDKGIPKLNKMVVKIKDHQPYKTEATDELCSIAKGRYFCDVYIDLDF